MRAVIFAAVCLLLSGTAFAQDPGASHDTVRAWPVADGLFQRDAGWRGGDGASSAPLGPERILWLFADSFVGASAGAGREGARMVRNSVAIQTGLDPASSRVRFFWGTGPAGPTSFFPEEGRSWYWPGSAILVDSVLLVFLMRVSPSADPLGFEVAGWSARGVRNPWADPGEWVLEPVLAGAGMHQIVLGSGGVLLLGEHLYAFGAKEPGGTHPVFLARWPTARAEALDLSDPEWWCGTDRGWVPQSSLTGTPEPLFENAQTEFTVHWSEALGSFVQTQSVGFGAADLAFRFADRVEGPWSEPVVFMTPSESTRKDAFVYAGKAHPWWSAEGVVVSYVANAWSFADLVRDGTLYYPRFVRVPFGAAQALLAASRSER